MRPRAASLHAKCVIADRSSALITSANLTSAGINDNIELGVLIEAGPLPARLHRHLELLIEERHPGKGSERRRHLPRTSSRNSAPANSEPSDTPRGAVNGITPPAARSARRRQ